MSEQKKTFFAKMKIDISPGNNDSDCYLSNLI